MQLMCGLWWCVCLSLCWCVSVVVLRLGCCSVWCHVIDAVWLMWCDYSAGCLMWCLWYGV